MTSDSERAGEAVPGRPAIDARFSLANERTFLAWMRTALGLIAGGIAAAKALDFQHELVRWVVAVPLLVGGAAMAVGAWSRWQRYEERMTAGRPLGAGPGLRVFGVALTAYAVLALVALALDG